MGDRSDVITETTSPSATNDYLREQRLLRKARQRAELYRALWVALMVILCMLTAILWALIKL